MLEGDGSRDSRLAGSRLATCGFTMHEFERVWRVRRGQAYIDALLRRRENVWDLRLTWNKRVLITQEFPDRETASASADLRLSALRRAGWASHW